MCGATVANAQATLQQRSRGLAELEDQPNCVVEELVILVFTGGRAIALSALVGRRIEEAFGVVGLALSLPEIDDVPIDVQSDA